MDFIHNVPIKVPNKSGFDLSHEHLFTGVCGELAPVLVHELLPNDSVSLGASFQVQLPPAVTDFYGRINFHLEAFFVPNRLCWAGWKDFITHPTFAPQYPAGTLPPAKSTTLPSWSLFAEEEGDFSSFMNRILGAGTLFDYLGYKIDISSVPDSYSVDDVIFKIPNLLPIVAYHRIWDDWYRDTRIQAPLFVPSVGSYYGANDQTAVASTRYSFFNIPYVVGNLISSSGSVSVASSFSSRIYNSGSGATIVGDPIALGDSTPFTNIRLRNWSKDLFTSASPYPQASIVGGRVELPVSNSNTSLSIAALRSANSLQQWLERNNLAGYRYADQIYAQFGRYPADAIMDRPLYLGRIKQAIYTRSVFQQSPSESSVPNPFNSVGAKYGSPQAVGDGSLIDSFTASEHGFLIVLASLVPHAYYSSGVNRMLKRTVIGDFAFPLLANMGDQSILKSELSSDISDYLYDVGGVVDGFGYTDLYAEYKVINDHVSGFLRDGYSLDSFVMQRSFGTDVALSSSFIQIPRTYLDQVLTVDVASTRSSYWADVYFVFKKSSTLPVYSQPTLMDLQSGHFETISRGGSRL